MLEQLQRPDGVPRTNLPAREARPMVRLIALRDGNQTRALGQSLPPDRTSDPGHSAPQAEGQKSTRVRRELLLPQ